MALNGPSADASLSNAQDGPDLSLPIFNVERVQLQFHIDGDFVAAQVANNVLILASAAGKIYRCDWDHPTDIDELNLPKKSTEIGLIRRIFLDPSASHLIINTTQGENYYLHSLSRQPRPLSRLKGVTIECIAWNPALPTASTREILVGSTDGNVYEISIEQTSEFYRREGGYTTQIWRMSDGAVSGIWVDVIPSRPDIRRVFIASRTKLLHFLGKVGGRGRDGSGSIYAELFRAEAPVVHESVGATAIAPSLLAIGPDASSGDEDQQTERAFAWLHSQGIFHGSLSTSPATQELANKIFSESKLLPRSNFPETISTKGGRKLIQDPVTAMTLTPWHILALVEGRIIGVNQLDGSQVYDQPVLEPGQPALGLVTDQKKNTFWLFTNQDVYEIVAENEDRDLWKIMLKQRHFDLALKYAKGAVEHDLVATASGDHLSSKGQYLEAAGVWAKSSKAFEEVCLYLIDNGQEDALQKYLMMKLGTYKKSSTMQRTMIAMWLIQIFMAKLNALDDMVATKAELVEHTDSKGATDQLQHTRKEYQNFVVKYKADLDAKSVYEVVGSHDREEELLFFAMAINDYDYVLSYYVQRERWADSLTVLNKQTDPEMFYKYGSVLMAHVASGLVEILMRQTSVDPVRVIPALLSYHESTDRPSIQNQAIRYLSFVINNYPNMPPSIHNTLLSILASHPSSSESALLSYLESQAVPPPYDSDFALRLCIQHERVQACVHIYSSMGLYAQAVSLALQHNDVDLAAIVADRPEGNPKLRKTLWLQVAEKKIQQDTGIKSAIEFLRRCELLKIEDLIPFFPDFVVIDDFKEEICSALEDYSRHIDALKQEMDTSALTAEQIQAEIKALDVRYAIVEPGEKCWICGLPVLSRQFFVFPCQHAFHSDCLGKKVLDGSGLGKKKHIKDLQNEVSRGLNTGSKREKMIRELDGLVAESCILCGDYGIKQIDEPFVHDADDKEQWAI